MAKAFLSHSSRDKDIVEKIALQLGRNNCHYDRLTFEAGSKTLDEIFKGLDDTDVFVLFISDAALESTWVKKEGEHQGKKAWAHLLDYLKIYQPVEWLFKGSTGGRYSELSVQEIFTRAKKRPMINPEATVHTYTSFFCYASGGKRR